MTTGLYRISPSADRKLGELSALREEQRKEMSSLAQMLVGTHQEALSLRADKKATQPEHLPDWRECSRPGYLAPRAGLSDRVLPGNSIKSEPSCGVLLKVVKEGAGAVTKDNHFNMGLGREQNSPRALGPWRLQDFSAVLRRSPAPRPRNPEMRPERCSWERSRNEATGV